MISICPPYLPSLMPAFPIFTRWSHFNDNVTVFVSSASNRGAVALHPGQSVPERSRAPVLLFGICIASLLFTLLFTCFWTVCSLASSFLKYKAQACTVIRGAPHSYYCPRFNRLPSDTSGKEPACQRRTCKRRRFDPWVGKIPWRRACQPTPVFFPGESLWTEELGCYSS